MIKDVFSEIQHGQNVQHFTWTCLRAGHSPCIKSTLHSLNCQNVVFFSF